jgi:hypothetical protein
VLISRAELAVLAAGLKAAVIRKSQKPVNPKSKTVIEIVPKLDLDNNCISHVSLLSICRNGQNTIADIKPLSTLIPRP